MITLRFELADHHDRKDDVVLVRSGPATAGRRVPPTCRGRTCAGHRRAWRTDRSRPPHGIRLPRPRCRRRRSWCSARSLPDMKPLAPRRWWMVPARHGAWPVRYADSGLLGLPLLRDRRRGARLRTSCSTRTTSSRSSTSGRLFPGHTLLVPKAHYETLLDLRQDLLAPLFGAAQRLAGVMESELGAAGSFVAVNNRVESERPASPRARRSSQPQGRTARLLLAAHEVRVGRRGGRDGDAPARGRVSQVRR